MKKENDLQLPQLKGKVHIKLINVETKEIEQEIEEENIVTNAIKKIYESNYFGGIYYPNLQPIFEKMLGGILCFGEYLTEDRDNVYPPNSTNPVLAHAGQTIYERAGIDSTRGLPNSVESGPIENGYKWVWEFMPSQGNGTIKALALTHKDTGDLWLFHGTNFNPFMNLQRSGYSLLSEANFHPRVFDTQNNLAYGFDIEDGYSGNLIKIYKFYDFSSTKDVDIFQSFIGTSYTLSKQDIFRYSFATNAGANPILNKNLSYLYVPQNNEIHFLSIVNNTGTIHRFIVNLNTMDYIQKDINLENCNLAEFTTNDGSLTFVPNLVLDNNNCIYLLNKDLNTIYTLDYFNETIISTVSIGSSLDLNFHQSLSCGNWSVIEQNTYNNTPLITDGIKSYQIQAEPFGWNAAGYHFKSPIEVNNKLVLLGNYISSRGANTCDFNLFLNKMYLATIKNLQTPIEKDTRHLLKIEYSLIET